MTTIFPPFLQLIITSTLLFSDTPRPLLFDSLRLICFAPLIVVRLCPPQLSLSLVTFSRYSSSIILIELYRHDSLGVSIIVIVFFFPQNISSISAYKMKNNLI